MPDPIWQPRHTLTLPYGTLQTLHQGVSEVCVRENLYTQERRVFKKVSLLGREGTLAVTEANILLRIDHPNIAKIFDVAEPTDEDAALQLVEIVMPYYEAGSVFDALHAGTRFSVGRARDLAVKALRGLSHLHQAKKVLHRDVKPANLFLSDDNTLIKVGDFGEATPMDANGEGPPLPSPQFWSAPECFTGSNHTVASEVYSIGMSLAEMLSGPFPYESYAREELGERLANGKPALPPRHLVPAVHIPSSVRRIVTKATRLDPADRYKSADAMRDALLNADLVDWSFPSVDNSFTEWSGKDMHGSEYRITAKKMTRNGGWRARGERRYPSGWRRLPQVPDVDGPSEDDAARPIFAAIDRVL